MFPPAEHKLLLMQLASSLEAIISQRLIATRKEGLWPAVEILRYSRGAKLITENKTAELREYIERGESGMQSFDQQICRCTVRNLSPAPRRCAGRPGRSAGDVNSRDWRSRCHAQGTRDHQLLNRAIQHAGNWPVESRPMKTNEIIVSPEAA